MNQTPASPLQSLQTPDLLQEQMARLKAEFPDLFTNEGRLNPAELLRLTGEMQRDHFDFSWSGKAAAKRKAFSPTTAALRYDEGRSVNPDMAGGNCIIEGENLEVLKLLLCAYRGQVKCIYIDPPYNTGNDFVYKDNFAEGTSAYWEQTGVTQDGVKMSTNTRADGRFHSNWLNMIYPRLLVARQLLREDGVIFVSIDDNEVTHLRKVMDEVFGEAEFQGMITVQSNKGGQDYKDLAKTHEYLLCYSKSEVTELNEIENEAKKFTLVDEIGGFEPRELRNRNPKFGRFNRPNLFYPIYALSETKDENGYCRVTLDKSLKNIVEVLPLNSLGNESCWRWGMPKLSACIDDETETKFEIFAKQKSDGGWNIYEKYRSSTSKAKTIWDETSVRTEAGTIRLGELGLRGEFDHPKPNALIEKILNLGSQEGDLTLDFFGGSGTFAETALSLKRNFILVQMPEVTESIKFKKISDITIERVKRVIQGYGDNPQPIDAGFKVFTLEKSAFPRADFAPDPDASAEQNLQSLKAFIAQKETNLFSQPDAPAVRDEVLLKCGFQLDVQLTPLTEVTANQLYRATDQQTPPRQAIVCFDTSLDTTTLEWLRQQKGQRVIVLEAALDTTAKWNLHHQLGDDLVVF